MQRFVKDPNAKLDYSVTWVEWLASDDSIVSATWTVGTGLTLSASPAPSISGGVATAWLEGGSLNEDYVVTCQITTAAGRIDERSFEIAVRDR